MSQLRWMVVIAVLLLSVGLDFVSTTLSVVADAALIGIAIYLLWPVFWNDKDGQ